MRQKDLQELLGDRLVLCQQLGVPLASEIEVNVYIAQTTRPVERVLLDKQGESQTSPRAPGQGGETMSDETSDATKASPPQSPVGTHWMTAALIGLVAGWIVGQLIRPGTDDLADKALALVPESATVLDTYVQEAIHPFYFFPAHITPHASVNIETPLTVDDVVAKFRTAAQREGWTIEPPIERPATLRVPVRTRLFIGHMFLRSGSAPDEAIDRSGWIRVSMHPWVGRTFIATTSILGGLIAGIISCRIHRRLGHTNRRLLPPAIGHWLALLFFAGLWLLALQYIH